MKAKLMSLLCLSVFSVILLAGIASAALTLTDTTTVTSVNHDDGSFDVTFTLVNDDETNPVALTWANVVSGSDAVIDETSLPIEIVANGSLDLTIPVTFPAHKAETISVIVDANSETFTSEVTINDAHTLSLEQNVVISEGDDSTQITVTNTGNMPLTGLVFTASPSSLATLTGTPTTLAVEGTSTFTFTINDLSDLDFGSNLFTVSAKATEMASSETTQITTTGSYCSNENEGSLGIDIDEINVNEGFGDDDEYWYPFDEVEVELEISAGRYDIEDIEIEWALLTESGDEIMDGSEDDFDLDEDDDDEKVTITLKLDEKLNKIEGEDKLIFYARAEGKIDDNSADEDVDNTYTCDWTSQEIEIRTDDQFVILDDIEFAETVFCGDEIQFTADVWNLDNGEQENVEVNVYNKELGIDETIEVGDIDSFEDEQISLLITIPNDAKAKFYTLEFRVYDEDNDIFENEEDDESVFTYTFSVEGCSNVEQEYEVLVSADLVSEAKAGKELVVKATITNSGTSLQAYGIEASGYSDWATLTNVDFETLVINPGDSKEVVFTFDVEKGISGEKTFNIEIASGAGDLIASQPVLVNFEGKGLAGITGSFLGGDSWYLWGIGLLNVILVVIIIIVAVRIARR